METSVWESRAYRYEWIVTGAPKRDYLSPVLDLNTVLLTVQQPIQNREHKLVCDSFVWVLT